METTSTKIPSPLTPMGFLAVNWAYACITMDVSLRKTDVNTGVQKQTAKKAASVKHLVHLLNMDELYILN